jgi:hypothetical protein
MNFELLNLKGIPLFLQRPSVSQNMFLSLSALLCEISAPLR